MSANTMPAYHKAGPDQLAVDKFVHERQDTMDANNSAPWRSSVRHVLIRPQSCQGPYRYLNILRFLQLDLKPGFEGIYDFLRAFFSNDGDNMCPGVFPI